MATSAPILLVEPDRLVRDRIVLALAGLDPSLDVILAADGVEALALAEWRPPRLVLLDLLLPRRSGLDVLRDLRARFGEQLPIIVISALGLREIVQRAIAAGASDFVVKPIDARLLVEKVRLALPQAGPARETA